MIVLSKAERYRRNLMDGLRALGATGDICPETGHHGLTFGESMGCSKHPGHTCFKSAYTPGEKKLPYVQCDTNLPNFPLECLELRLEKAASRHPRTTPAPPTSQ